MIWFSDFRIAMKNMMPITYETEKYRIAFPKQHQKITRGDPIPIERFPSPVWLDPKTTRKVLLEVFRITNRYMLVSERFRELVAEFETGSTQFVEAEVLQKDRKTPFPGRFFHMNITEKFACFVPEGSAARYGNGIWAPNIVDKIIVNVRAETEPPVDMWIDPILYEGVFFSDRLAKACRRAKIKGLSLHKCGMVPVH